MQYFSTQQLRDEPADILDAAKAEPVLIVEAGRPSFVLMSMAQYDRLRGRGPAMLVALDPPKEPDKDDFRGMPPFSLENYELDRDPDESDEDQKFVGETYVLLGLDAIDHIAFVVGYFSGALGAVDALTELFRQQAGLDEQSAEFPQGPAMGPGRVFRILHRHQSASGIERRIVRTADRVVEVSAVEERSRDLSRASGFADGLADHSGFRWTCRRA